MPTYAYDHQRWPALFWGFVNPVWTGATASPNGPMPQPHTPPSPWSVTDHQTAGLACAHLLLAGLFVTFDRFPYQELIDDYYESQLGPFWDTVPSWHDLRQYEQRLTSFKLRMPDNTEYRWLQEGFLPVDPATLFARVRSSPTARIWTGAPGDQLHDTPWTNWEDLAAALEAWQIQAIAAEPIVATASDFTRKMTPHWHHQSPVAAIVFENSD